MIRLPKKTPLTPANSVPPAVIPHGAVVPPKPFFRAQVTADGVMELIVYEQIGEDYDFWSGETSGISARLIKEKLDATPDYSSILMRINSPGGDAFEGVAILNLLRSQAKPVNVMIDGIAASAASVIAMAGTTIQMGSGAMMMIHNAWGFCMGNTHDMAQQAAALMAIDKAIASAYADRTGGNVADIQVMMDEETWMGAEECIAAGFATGMQSAPSIDAKKAMALAKGFKALNRFNKVPKKLKVVETPKAEDPGEMDECQCDCKSCEDGMCENCTNMACDDKNCVDCPMQGSLDASAHSRIAVMASVLRTAPSIDVQVRSKSGSRILALRKSGSAKFNLVPATGTGKQNQIRVTGTLAPYESLSCDLGGFKEVYAKGCFTESIDKDDPMVLLNHNIDVVLGRKSAGTARFSEDLFGLSYEVDLPDTQAARDLKVSMERGDVSGSSAAFFIDEYHWENRGGVRVRVIEKAQLLEGGPHTLAAYNQSSAEVDDNVDFEADNDIEQYGARLQLLKIA